MSAPVTASSQSAESVSPSDAGTDPAAFWPTNGTSGSQPQQADSSDICDSMARVSLSPSGQCASRSPAATFAPNPLLAHNNYWSSATAPDTDTTFLNGSTYSPGYSSGGSSSGSPQSPMTRPTSRPITGAKPVPVQPSPMYYPKPQDKQGWKSGHNVWGPYPGPKAGVAANVGQSAGQNAVGHSYGHKEKEWKETRINSSQYPQHQQHQQPQLPPFQSYRSSMSSMPRPGSMGGRPVVPQQPAPQPQSQTDWSVGPTGGGWGPSLSLHAARKFGRRNRGNATF